jgi:tetratricopeptide (TPR) repeat protein
MQKTIQLMAVVLACGIISAALATGREKLLDTVSRRPGTIPRESPLEPITPPVPPTPPPLTEEELFVRDLWSFVPPEEDLPLMGIAKRKQAGTGFTDYELNQRHTRWKCSFLWGEAPHYYAVSDVSSSGECFFAPAFLKPYAPLDVPNPWFAAQAIAKLTSYEFDRNQFAHSDVTLTPRETLKRGRGDCEDLSLLLASWLRAMGRDARLVSGTLDGEGHRWVVLYQEGQVYLLEATSSRPARTPPVAKLQTRYAAKYMFDSERFWTLKAGASKQSYDPKDWVESGAFTPFSEGAQSVLRTVVDTSESKGRGPQVDTIVEAVRTHPELFPIAEAQLELWREWQLNSLASLLVNRLVKLAPRNLKFRLELAAQYFAKMDHAGAYRALEPVLDHPDAPKWALSFAAGYAEGNGDLATARAIWRRHVARFPKDESGYLSLANIERRVNGASEATAVLRRCLASLPQGGSGCRALLRAWEAHRE